MLSASVPLDCPVSKDHLLPSVHLTPKVSCCLLPVWRRLFCVSTPKPMARIRRSTAGSKVFHNAEPASLRVRHVIILQTLPDISATPQAQLSVDSRMLGGECPFLGPASFFLRGSDFALVDMALDVLGLAGLSSQLVGMIGIAWKIGYNAMSKE